MLFVCRAMLIFCVLVTLLACGACTQQKWRFAEAGQLNRLPGRMLEPSFAGNMGESVALPAQAAPQKVVATKRSLQAGPTPSASPDTPGGLPRSTFPSQVGATTQPARLQQAPTQPYVAARPNFNANPQPELYAEPTPQDLMSPGTALGMTPSVRPVSNSTFSPMVSPTVGAGLGGPCVEPSYCDEPVTCCPDRPFFHPRSLWQDVCGDYRNYYTCRNARGYLYAIAGGSLLANTSLDDDFRNWYQDDVRSTETDNFAAFWKTFGEGEYVVPFFACTAVVGKALDQFPVADVVGEHGYRTTRAYLVGVPPMIFSQHLLGGSRPDENPHQSMWRPFNDNNGVSGHSFMGAIPFITAAQMSECWFTRACFYTLSTFPAWSRINDDAHYLSQSCLGWYMAYMACSSVNQTANPNRCFEVMPVCQPKGAGIMAIWKR